MLKKMAFSLQDQGNSQRNQENHKAKKKKQITLLKC